MAEQQKPVRTVARGDDTANSNLSLSRPSSVRKDSSKSTPSTNDPFTETSSLPATAGSAITPRTPYTPSETTIQSQRRMPASSPRVGPSSGVPSESSTKQAKVAIPRLKRSLESGEGQAKSGGRHRVTHACEPCRHRKTKCSGERPACRHCQDFKIACYYADGKRDRVKKQFGSMQDKVADYERILRDLATRVSDADADIIRTTLERAALMDTDDPAADKDAVPSVEGDLESEPSGAESEVSGGRGSTGALDRTEEDFTREAAKSTGFMGKNSDVTWMQRLHQENKYGEGATHGPGPNNERLAHIAEADQGFTIQESSYHLNDLPISTYEAVDPYEMPTPEHANMLFTTYMLRMHPYFPIVGRINLQNQFSKFLARPSQKPPPKWLAIINMIFAIAARYSHLVQADWQADDRDHLIYFSRARLLAIDTETLFNHPDLQMIQIFGLMSMYLLATDQLNRAWQLAGLAIRASTSLGLNMRNESANLSDGLKEIRYRVWWALYNLEHQLCAMTGRVNCILDEHCTTPLPVPMNEEEFDTVLGKKLLSKEHQRSVRAPSSNAHTPSAVTSTPSSRSGSNRAETTSRSPSAQQNELDWTKDVTPSNALYFLHLVQLSRLTQQVFHGLYNPNAVDGRWSDIQRQISDLNQQLEQWYRKLTATFDFRRKQRDKDFYEARLALGFLYYGTKMMLHRPCLCRLDRKIPGQSNKSSEFNHTAATTCVVAAQDQLALIPDEPNAVGLVRTGPWVVIVHQLVQSATVLMLELSFRAHHMPQQVDELVESAKKAIRWLHALGDENLAAARAWRLCSQMLRGAAVKVGRSHIDDLPLHPPRSADPESDDTNMSSGTATMSHSYQSTHGPQNHFVSAGMRFPSTSIPNLPAFSQAGTYDPFMHYDQYFPSGNLDSDQPQYNQNPNQLPFENVVPTDAEMDFFEQYADDQDTSGARSRLQGGRSGYG